MNNEMYEKTEIEFCLSCGAELDEDNETRYCPFCIGMVSIDIDYNHQTPSVCIECGAETENGIDLCQWCMVDCHADMIVEEDDGEE